VDQVQVGGGLGHGGEHPGLVERPVGARGRGPGALLRPAVARRDQPELGQAEVGHHPRDGADVLGQLRPIEDDDRDVHRGCLERGEGRA
jgi:hypothetical protein